MEKNDSEDCKATNGDGPRSMRVRAKTLELFICKNQQLAFPENNLISAPELLDQDKRERRSDSTLMVDVVLFPEYTSIPLF